MKNSNIVETDISWKDWGVNDIKKELNKIKASLKIKKNEILKLKDNELNFKNVIHKGEDNSSQISRTMGYLWSFVNLSKDIKIQNKARTAELELTKILRKYSYDQDIYNVFVKYYSIFRSEKLTDEEIKIVEDMNLNYKKMGMHLDKKSKKRLLEKQNKISKIASEFDKKATLNYGKGLYFKKEELEGVPENILQNFKHDEKKKKYFVSIRPTEMSYVSKYCKVENTRKELVTLSANGVGDVNTKRFAEILELRNEISKMLGFKTFADLNMTEEMVSDPREVNIFLKNLLKEITPILKNELDEDLNSIKEYDKSVKKLTTWNWAFAANLSKEKEMGIKEEEYKPYFELTNVLSVLFKIWEDIFDVKTSVVQGKIFFDETATFYKFENKKTRELLGHGVFDLFPRPLKYGHACMADISKSYVDVDANRHSKLIYMVCNFMQNKNGKNLLSFSDAITLFHEGGHFLHFLLMKNNYISTSSVSNDFVEIPSQFHENFLLNEKFVEKNFMHFETKKSMPKKLLNNISKMSKKGEASAWVMQSMYSLFDQEIHGKNIDKYFKNFKELDNLFETMFQKYFKIESTPNRHFTSRFSHLTGGYEAKYYSYVVSRVYAQDFWNEFSKGGIKKGKVSEKYKKFLEGANKKPEKELVNEFLGRPVNQQPFLNILKK